MNRKLIALNLVLIALLGAAGWEIKQRWEQARQREKALAAQKPATPPTPAMPKAEPVAPAPASNYIDIAQRMVFAKDRNPNVVIEEKPPEPTPPFPFAFGYLDFGGNPTVFMSEKVGAAQKGYHLNDSIGPFKITALNRTDITLEWKDKKFEKKLTELKPKASEAEKVQQAVAAPEPPKATVMTNPKDVEEIQKQNSSDGLPGLNVGGTVRMCSPGDTAPAGTVQGGFRKVITTTPFGQSCRWEPAR